MLGERTVSEDIDFTGSTMPADHLVGAAPVWSRQHNDVALTSALTIAAHDLRGPLANLSVLIELIEAFAHRRAFDQLPARARQARDIIDALDKMLTALLQRVRTTGDPLGFTPTLVDLNDIVQDAFLLNHPMAESRSIRLHYFHDQPLSLWGDADLLHQAVENIINNAVKHSPTGKMVTGELERDGDTAVIRISDQGNGLNLSDIKRAFRPFATLSSKPEINVRSWGLGLWICRLVIERHGGSIDADVTQPGGGAIFTIRLPMTVR